MVNIVYQYFNFTNLTAAGNQTNILTFVGGVNDIMGTFPATLILIAIAIVILMALDGKGLDPFRNFATTSFVMLILTLILYPTGLITGGVLLIFAILCPVSIFILWIFGGQQFG